MSANQTSTNQISAKDLKAFTGACVGAYTSHQDTMTKASATRLEKVSRACGGLPKGLTSQGYDKQVGPALVAAFKVVVDAGKMTEGTASKERSNLKTLVLACLNGFAPGQGEGYGPAVERAGDYLVDRKNAQGEPIRNAKTGGKPRVPTARKGVGSKGGKSKGSGAGKLTPVSGTEPGFKGSPQLAAALILTKNNKARADKLVIIMETYCDEFDRWTSTVITKA